MRIKPVLVLVVGLPQDIAQVHEKLGQLVECQRSEVVHSSFSGLDGLASLLWTITDQQSCLDVFDASVNVLEVASNRIYKRLLTRAWRVRQQAQRLRAEPYQEGMFSDEG